MGGGLAGAFFFPSFWYTCICIYVNGRYFCVTYCHILYWQLYVYNICRGGWLSSSSCASILCCILTCTISFSSLKLGTWVFDLLKVLFLTHRYRRLILYADLVFYAILLFQCNAVNMVCHVCFWLFQDQL